ncbi:RHS repeat-associated core domain-containing protein [Pseudomonas sp. S32]|uniref:RHS repeat-associated core domain-containing protein n=1 Tax=Pseudomonas sp. S32 TaxID=2767448 RepID=UPI001911A71E|nr:RHS repeat-associated core domain-containing protein [Pseudomonas sp. S32]MBK5005470.1 RHS repeat-associated core domain-containing protein [Pseudomonas sp. S32]
MGNACGSPRLGRAYTVYGYQGQASGRTWLGYTGEYLDRRLQGYPLGAGHRYYSPALMRFVSSDVHSPFGKGGLNAYVYCVGNPVVLSDPTGQAPLWPKYTRQAPVRSKYEGLWTRTPQQGAALSAASSAEGSISVVNGRLQFNAAPRDVLNMLKNGKWVRSEGKTSLELPLGSLVQGLENSTLRISPTQTTVTVPHADAFKTAVSAATTKPADGTVAVPLPVGMVLQSEKRVSWNQATYRVSHKDLANEVVRQIRQ